MHDLQLGDNFSTWDARVAGVSRSRLRRSDLLKPHHGVRAMTPATDLIDRCRAFLPAMGPRMLFSHATAALLHGLPLPPAMTDADPLHVSARAPMRAPRHVGVRGHQTRQPDDAIVSLHGLPVSSPVETWCQMASVLQERDLVVLGDALLTKRNPLATVDDLVLAVDASPCRPGIRRLRSATSRVRPRTESPMETILRLAIVDAGLPEPAVDYRILGATGEAAAHGDLVFPSARVVVEYDGDHHRTDARQYYIDVDRLWRIRSLGWEVVRINKSHMSGNAVEAIRRIRLALAST